MPGTTKGKIGEEKSGRHAVFPDHVHVHFGKQIFSVSQPIEPQDPHNYDPYAAEAEAIMRDAARITQRFRSMICVESIGRGCLFGFREG